MNITKLDKVTTSKRLGVAAAILCVGCCAIIPVLGLLGVTVAAGLRFYVESVAVVLLIASLSLLAYHFKNKKARPSCEIDCSCKDETTS